MCNTLKYKWCFNVIQFVLHLNYINVYINKTLTLIVLYVSGTYPKYFENICRNGTTHRTHTVK